MGIKQLYNDNLRKLPNEYGDVSVMVNIYIEKINTVYGIHSAAVLIGQLKLSIFKQKCPENPNFPEKGILYLRCFIE